MDKNLQKLDEILLSANVVEKFNATYSKDLSFKTWLDGVLPEVEKCSKQQQRTPWHLYDVLTHTLKSVQNVNSLSVDIPEKNRRLLAYTMFMHDMGKPGAHKIKLQPDGTERDGFYGHADLGVEIAERTLKEFGFDKKEIEKIKILIKHHDITAEMYDEISEKKQKYFLDGKFVNELIEMFGSVGDGRQMLNYLTLVAESDNKAQNPELTGEPLRIIDKINILNKKGDLEMFENMTDVQQYCFRKAIDTFMKNFNIKNYGVVLATLQQFPELREKLTSLNSTKEVEFEESYYEKFRATCEELNKEFERRYEMFYTYCVGDPVLSYDAKNSLGGSLKVTNMLLQPKSKEFDEFCDGIGKSNDSYSKNLDAFAGFLKDEDGLIKSEIEKCYERSYS